jgi:hypothetical protein
MRFLIVVVLLLGGCTEAQWAQVSANVLPTPKARCEAEYAEWQLVATGRDAQDNPTYTYRCRALD